MAKRASIWKAPKKFRPAGSPAGTWPHTPWHVCVLHDPYERVNFWSHFLPGVALVVLGLLGWFNLTIGGLPLVIFCGGAAMTHLLSALTHVWPDDHVLEKIDHLGIMGLLLGVPFSATMAKDPEADLMPMGVILLLFIAAAFLTPALRTISYVTLGGAICFLYYQIVNYNLVAQVVMYLIGAYAFVRNSGHERGLGFFADHHMLHYFTSAGAALHVLYIRDAVTHQVHFRHPTLFPHD
eukprot:CAMPEP_0202864134 /NCGR_PEP_ID=MMETSP1391-20130828/4499_1 /ASSEMBLY_ACC=CAM_ASM_000867 /TAXON_ID=1034604 /ORGANISM="Chlamydomonas leiostraca, Strain SAG 11-49" /LENGTH=237 /DNA_ID=CAMNT_0049543847 /DNA_START=126 /DNA_END=839 /DNA_ORIENTATION=-